jgi:hypothetical protein
MTADDALDPIGVALRVARAIEATGGAYFVGGSLASSFHGEPRATNDVDFVVQLPLGRIGDLIAALGTDFEVDADMLRDALLHGGSSNIFYMPAVMKVDLFAVGPDPYDEEEFRRRKAVPVRGEETLVLETPEDTVLRKLLWYRAGNYVSSTQWRDVVAVLRISGPELDKAYLTSWARRLKLTDLLDRATGEAAEH